MSGLLDPNDEMVIQGVQFSSENLVEIIFFEKRDQSEAGGLMKTVIFNPRDCKVSDQIDDIVDSLNEVVDAVLLALRNPPKLLDPRARLQRRAAMTEGEDEDQEDDADD
jgi:hypothetical protein